MEIKYIEEPFPYILIDDHYDEEQQNLIWEELDYITHPLRMESSNESDNRRDDSAKDEDTGETLKNTHVVWLKSLFVQKNQSNILMNMKVDRDVLTKHRHWYFNCRTASTYDTQVLYYENGHEYKPHYDSTIFTSLTWFYKKPKAFIGGDFIFPEFDTKVELKDNRTIIFPGCLLHQVTPVSMKENKSNSLLDSNKMGRYCISQFIM